MQCFPPQNRPFKFLKSHFLQAAIFALLLISIQSSWAETIARDYVSPDSTVIALDLSATLTNGDTYTITTTDLSFQLYGAYSKADSQSDPGNPVANTGDFYITITDGLASIDDYAIGVYAEGFEGGLINHGSIYLTATGVSKNDRADATFYGISGTDTGDILNYGDLLVEATGGGVTPIEDAETTNVKVIGLGGVSTGAITNYGNIKVSSTGGDSNTTMYDGLISLYAEATATAYGIYDQYTWPLSQPVINEGDILSTASGGTAEGSGPAYAQATAKGIMDNASPSCTNSGNITANANGGTATSTNSASYATASATGIDSDTLNNTGKITVSAQGGISESNAGSRLSSLEMAYANSYASASGISCSNFIHFTNSGDITASAVGGTATSPLAGTSANATAYGISLTTQEDATNDGNITVSASGGTANSSDSTASATAYAYGIRESSSETPILYNNGNITANATGGTATGSGGSADKSAATAWATGIYYGGGTLINTGDIVVSATSGNLNDTQGSAMAYGIYISVSVVDTMPDVFLTNTGTITATSTTPFAYEVALLNGTTTLVDTYNLTLDQDPSRGSILVGTETAVLDLNNTALTVSLLDNDIQWGTSYAIFENHGTITGSFFGVSLSALNPNIAVSYDTLGTEDPSDDTLKVTYGNNNAVSPFAQSAGATLNLLGLTGNTLNQRMMSTFLATSTETGGTALVADSGVIRGEANSGYLPKTKEWNAYLLPFYTDIHTNADPTGYEGRFSGTFFGMTHRASSAWYGFDLGFGRADFDYLGTGMDKNNEDQDIFTLGGHAMGRVNNWIWQLQGMGMESRNRYSGLTGTNLLMGEKAEYHSYGLASSMSGGYLYRFGRHIFMPELGIAYNWIHRQGFSTEAEDSAWNLSYASLDEHQVFARGSVRWMTRMEAGLLGIEPVLAAGVKKRLTDDELSVEGSMTGNAPFKVTSSQDDIAATLNASLRFDCRKNAALTLAYDGEYGEDTAVHNFWVKLNFFF